MTDLMNPLVSCLCVTEDRPAFMPWLLWCFERQRWPQRELVIVDSSVEPLQITPERDDIRVLAAEPGTRVAKKRNMALRAARGEIITWFDDDDWQHPDKLAWLIDAMRSGAPYAGSCHAWFVDLSNLTCKRYRGTKRRVVFNSAGFQREVVMDVRFQENLRQASDSRWMLEMATRHRGQANVLDREDIFFWLCHDGNLSNPAKRRHLTQPIETLKEEIGQEAWGDTDEALKELKVRLHQQKADRQAVQKINGETRVRVRLNEPEITKDTQNDEPIPPVGQEPPIGVMIKATVMDAPYLDVMARHMIAQARYPFAERAIVVDRQSIFRGKYRNRPRASQEQLDQTLTTLLSDSIIDQVREVDMTPSVIKKTMQRYFARNAHRVPTHANTGGPIYATLFGLESMSTDYVLQMDADIFFHCGENSWISQARQCMTLDPRLWLMMTHPGPPAGPPGNSLGPRNTGRAAWDEALGIWRFRHATTRYFLCDRRKLRQRLLPVNQAGGCAPLEQCLSASLRKQGAFRGNLGNLESWHLHAWYHGTPFAQWAPGLVKAVEAGHYPATQRGEYDLRLDREVNVRAWKAVLKETVPKGEVTDTLTSDLGKPPVPKTPKKRRRRPQKQAREQVGTEPDQSEMDDLKSARIKKNTHARTEGRPAPIAVVIPIRNRAGQRLRNSLWGLHWQSAGSPSQVLVVSHGSQPDIDRELKEICDEESATLITLGNPHQPWNKSLALNRGIRATRTEIPFLMTMDADMVLSPNFLEVVFERLQRDPPALVLCRISDLPKHASLPNSRDKLFQSLKGLQAMTRLRKRTGSGGIQAARRSFFYDIRGYDEDLLWWGAMDGDILNRAQIVGLQIEWIEDRATMLHQWHPRKHRILDSRREIEQARRHWRRNHDIVRSRAKIVRRNPAGWGGVAE